MAENALLYAILLLTAGLVSGITALLLWRRRSVLGVDALFVFFIALLIWSSTYAFYWLSSTPQDHIFWLNVTYFGVVLTPISSFVFALQYTNRGHLISRYTLALLAIEPLITLLLLWSDPWHGIFFAGKRTPLSSTIFDGGVWFWFHIIYSYGLMLIIYGLLWQDYWRKRGTYRKQVASLIFAFTIPWLSNIISLVDLNPVPALDLTPFAFTLTGLITSYALLYTRLFDLVPVARGKVMETMYEPVFVVDEHGRLVDSNPAGVRLLSQLHPNSKTDFEGRNMRDLFSQWETWSASEPLQTEIQLSLLGKLTYYECLISPLLDHRQRQQGKVVLFHNITRRKQVHQREFEIALEKERLRMLTRFIEGASHEFRTPLSIIQSSAYLIPQMPDEHKRNAKVEQIELQVQRMTRLVDMLLMMARLENRADFKQEPVDVNVAVHQALQMLANHKYRSSQANAKLRYEPEAQLPKVLGDVDYLSEALRQIIDNAYRHTPAEGCICITLGCDAEQVWIKIADTGEGIEAQAQTRIFETFWRQEISHSLPGFGLGLAIAQKIVHMHKGSISVDSELGKGSAFTLHLPRADTDLLLEIG